jgi:hypothetical protein
VSPSTVFDTAYWINRAEEARRLAEGMQDANTRILMLGIAECYEVIAKSYEKIAKWKERQGEPEEQRSLQHKMNNYSSPAPAQVDLKGVVKRIHGIGAARRIEIALGSEPAKTISSKSMRRTTNHGASAKS